MLLDERENISYEKRIDRAFRSDYDENIKKENMEIFDRYALGGIEVIYEIFENDLGSREDLLFHLVEFLDFDELGDL